MPRPPKPPAPDTSVGGRRPARVKLNPVWRVALAFPCVLWYSVYMDDWVWALAGGAVTLAAAVVVVLWQAFKHLDLKIERLGSRLDDKIDRLGERLDDKIDKISKKLDDQRNHFDKKFDEMNKRFDQVMASIAETSRLVAGHDERIKAQQKETDRLSSTVFGPQPFSAPSQHHAPGQHHVGGHAPEPTPPAEAASPGEGITASAGGPEPTPPTAAIAQA